MIIYIMWLEFRFLRRKISWWIYYGDIVKNILNIGDFLYGYRSKEEEW